MCSLREPLGDIRRIEMYALFIIIIIIIIIIINSIVIIISILLLIIIIYYYQIINFAFQLKGKKFWKRTKMHLAIILIERIPLLQVYFNHFITKQGAIFNNTCFKQGAQFCSACSSSGLTYYGLANWSFRRQIPCVRFVIIIIYYKVFLCFFPNQFF